MNRCQYCGEPIFTYRDSLAPGGIRTECGCICTAETLRQVIRNLGACVTALTTLNERLERLANAGTSENRK